MKKILITGAGSYIGTSVEKWLNRSQFNGIYQVDTIDVRGDEWKKKSFSGYDAIFHVAGIAHVDVGRITAEKEKEYYRVNTDLVIEVAKKAKGEGVTQFLFMSSMIIYSGCSEKIINRDTVPLPLNCYGNSKWQADQKVRKLANRKFKVAVIRPPMIYGKGSKGNYPILAEVAIRLPVFPKVKNKRSMLHIDNLCQFVKLLIDNEDEGVFFPQNNEYVNTSDMVRMIAAVNGHKIQMIPFPGFIIEMLKKMPGKIGELVSKAFGDFVYEIEISTYKENYCIYNLYESIGVTEK